MLYNTEQIEQRLDEWTSSLASYRLPSWDKLPELDLYMDQVIILLTRYLGPLVRDPDDKDDKPITSSIINNYVRMKIMPPPVKKKYNRIHLAYLLVICTLKQGLSISCIQRLLPQDWSEESAKSMYLCFTEFFDATVQTFLKRVRADDHMLDSAGLVTSVAVLTNLSKGLTEYLIRENEPEDADDDEDDSE